MRNRLLELCCILRVQSWDSAALAPGAIKDALGIAWPEATGDVASGSVDVLCVGPTDWLVIATDPDAGLWLRLLKTACQGSSFRATDVSHALARIEIDGPKARELLAKGSALDLDSSRFAPGRSAQTRFAGMPLIVHCTGQSTFKCTVAKSYAHYLLAWLEDGAMEFSVTR